MQPDDKVRSVHRSSMRQQKSVSLHQYCHQGMKLGVVYHHLLVPWTQSLLDLVLSTQYTSGPTSWNGLPVRLRDPADRIFHRPDARFRQMLKTFLF